MSQGFVFVFFTNASVAPTQEPVKKGSRKVYGGLRTLNL